MMRLSCQNVTRNEHVRGVMRIMLGTLLAIQVGERSRYRPKRVQQIREHCIYSIRRQGIYQIFSVSHEAFNQINTVPWVPKTYLRKRYTSRLCSPQLGSNRGGPQWGYIRCSIHYCICLLTKILHLQKDFIWSELNFCQYIYWVCI